MLDEIADQHGSDTQGKPMAAPQKDPHLRSTAAVTGYHIHAITNGVHTFTWTCDEMAKLFDKYIPGWANEPELFVRSGSIPELELWEAHREAKRKLLTYVGQATGVVMDPNVLTFGFARRATA